MPSALDNLAEEAADEWATQPPYAFGRDLAQYSLACHQYDQEYGHLAGIEVLSGYSQPLSSTDSDEEAIRLGALQQALYGKITGLGDVDEQVRESISECQEALRNCTDERDIDKTASQIGGVIESA